MVIAKGLLFIGFEPFSYWPQSLNTIQNVGGLIQDLTEITKTAFIFEIEIFVT